MTVLHQRAATVGDAPAVADLLTAAFLDDPLWRWVEPDDDVRRRSLRGYYEADTAGTMALGASDLLLDDDGGLIAAAIWVPSGHLADGFLTAPGLAAHWSSVAGARLQAVMRVMEEMAPSERHWYLDLLAVDPRRQGGGLGGVVLGPGLERADDERLPCALETARPANLRFYQRLGFALTEEVGSDDAQGGNPRPALWAMVRRAAA